MRCNRCGAASRVTYTTEQPEQFRTKRRRICDNGHRFTTYEVHESIVLAVGKVKLASRVRGYLKNAEQYARDLRIWQARVLRGEKYTILAGLFQLSEPGVRRVVSVMSKQRAKQQLGARKEPDEP